MCKYVIYCIEILINSFSSILNLINKIQFEKILLIFFFPAHCAEVCYPPYGCFNDNYPFDEALVQLPFESWF